MPASSGRKILFLTRCLDVGGAQRQLIELAIGLQRNGWLVTVVTFYGAGALEMLLQEAGVRVLNLEKRGRWDIFKFTWRLGRLLRQERPDVVHGSDGVTGILPALAKLIVRDMHVVWAVPAGDMSPAYLDWVASVEFVAAAVFSRFADLIIPNSEAGRRYHIEKGYWQDRMIVIPNGIDVEQFKPDKVARARIRAEWGISNDQRLVGVVARLDPIKDHGNFLRAASLVSRERTDVRFVCVGTGPVAYSRELLMLADRLGLEDRLIWAGERTDMASVYNALDLAVSPSLSEGLPNVVPEAMATGVPCVVTDVGDSAQVVANLGWVSRPGDSEALAHAIASALKALPCDGVAIRERVKACYSARMLVERTHEELLRLMRMPHATHAGEY